MMDHQTPFTLAGAWAGGTEYGVNLVLLIKILCLVLCVTWFLFVIFGGLKGFLIYFVSHHSYLCGVEVYHTCTH